MDTVIAAFTERGVNLALRLSEFLGAEVFAPERFSREGVNVIDLPLSEWTGKYFHSKKALIFISACGIAVRSTAPHVKDKMSDPAVIVIDETGRYVIPILSGHVGGANEISRSVAKFLNAQAIITTATDINNLTAIDEWAVNNDCLIENPGNIKDISGSVLEGKNVGVAVTSDDITPPFPVTLFLRPKVLVLGAGCNRGADAEEFERFSMDFLSGAGVSALSLKAIASINIKSDEPAMKIFAERHNIPFLTFSADELQTLNGRFTVSETVMKYTGTDNVCERACILAAGEGSVLLRSKVVYNGKITFALARIKNKNLKQRQE